MALFTTPSPLLYFWKESFFVVVATRLVDIGTICIVKWKAILTFAMFSNGVNDSFSNGNNHKIVVNCKMLASSQNDKLHKNCMRGNVQVDVQFPYTLIKFFFFF